MLNPDFHDILSEFVTGQVEFLLAGAYALAAHGLPRSTDDIDLWVNNSEQNARRIFAALIRFGTPMANIKIEDLQSVILSFKLVWHREEWIF